MLRRRIIYLGNDAGYFISHRLPQARAALRAGYEVHVATPLSDDVNDIKREGFEFHPIPLKRWRGRFIDEISSFVAIFRLYRSLRPDLVYHVTIKPILYGGIAARLAHVPAVVNAMTGLGYVFLSSKLKVRILRVIVKKVYQFVFRHPNSRVIFQNPDDLRSFLRENLVDETKAVLIMGSGVDLNNYTPQPEPQGIPSVVLASRLLWDKGVGEFVEAARILKESGIAARFLLVGEPEIDNPATVPQDILESWDKSGLIEWLGYRRDMPLVFAQANVVCLPSYREGLPKVLIEAAACGRAIVTTDTPGCREIVRHGDNGLLVPERNAVALANALKILLTDAGMRSRMGRRSRAIAASEFSIERVVEQILTVFKELLN